MEVLSSIGQRNITVFLVSCTAALKLGIFLENPFQQLNAIPSDNLGCSLGFPGGTIYYIAA